MLAAESARGFVRIASCCTRSRRSIPQTTSNARSGSRERRTGFGPIPPEPRWGRFLAPGDEPAGPGRAFSLHRRRRSSPRFAAGLRAARRCPQDTRQGRFQTCRRTILAAPL